MRSNNQQLVDDATDAPSTLLNASIQSTETRGPGLILTKDQIISLRLYELAGMALPTTLKDVQNYLTYTRGGGQGLEPEDFLKSFTLIKDHASRWDHIRSRIKVVGSGLSLFADTIQTYGERMYKLEARIDALNLLDEYNIETLEDVKKLEVELGGTFPGIGLGMNDMKTVGQFARALTKIFEQIQVRKNEAEIIKQLLDSFSRDLDRRVIPEIQSKVKLIDTSKLPNDIKALEKTIEDRSTRIAELDKAYSEAVKKSISSAFGSGVAGLAMAIYSGVEAEKIRKERNALKNVQSGDIRKLEQKQHVMGALHRVKFDMQNLGNVAVDAAAATHNLRTVWDSLYLYIESSLKASGEIDDALDVMWFMDDFREVVNPWKKIGQDSQLLLDVFVAADKELQHS